MAHQILIADDYEGVRRAIAEALKKAGFEIMEAVDGEEAIRLARERRPDAVLLDVVMPGRDGLAVCREIRSMEGHRNTPVIMCTVKGTKEDLDAALAAGADDYVVKPFHPNMIVRKLKRHLGGQRPEAIERRGSARRDAKLSMLWQSADESPAGVLFRADIFNISVTGVAFRYVPDPPPEDYSYAPHTVHPTHVFYRYAADNPEGEPAQMTIELPNRDPVRAEARFVYIVRQGKEEMCGAQFTRLSDPDHRRLAAYIKENLRDLIDSKHDWQSV